MLSSHSKRIYDLIISKLNENTKGVTFSGNFTFEFNQQQLSNSKNFEIVQFSNDGLSFESNEVVPVVSNQRIQIPFVQSNDQNDWELEYYIAIKVIPTKHPITGKEEIKFEESLNEYQAMLETLDNFKSELTFVSGEYKHSFKVKEPVELDILQYNSEHYVIMGLGLYMTEIKKGYFGNETSMYLGLIDDVNFGETTDYKLDVVEMTESSSKLERAKSNNNETEEKFTVDKRTWMSTFIVNFTGNTADLLLMKEKNSLAGIDQTYKLRQTNNNLNTDTSEDYNYTYDVIVTNINAVYENSKVVQFTFTLKRA